MNRLMLCPTLLLMLALSIASASQASAQSHVVSVDGQPSVTIDAARFGPVVVIDSPWNFQPSDDPRFADPAFDDSEWRSASPATNLLFSDAGLPDIPAGRGWLRLHLQILHPGNPLSITIKVRGSSNFAIFANGIRVGASSAYDRGGYSDFRPVQVSLPQTPTVVLAIRIVSARGFISMRYFPLERVELGNTQSVSATSQFERLRHFEDQSLGGLFIAALFLTFVPIGFTLLLAQPKHPEYFWLTAYCFFSGVDAAFAPLSELGIIPGTAWLVDLSFFAQSFLLISGLEFARTLAGTPQNWLILLIETSTLIEPILLSLNRNQIAETAASIAFLLWIGAITAILYTAFRRRGKKDCALLLLTMLYGALGTFLGELNGAFSSVPLIPAIHILGIGFGGPNSGISQPATLAGLIAVVLYRFIKVSKDEQLAATELEAARTVQQLLIPAMSPSTPGFTIASVYLPARHVGGDFFLVLPAPEGSGDLSLLAIMGDVSGKGLQAAMVVSTIIGGLRMQLSRQPAEVLTHLNRVLVGNVSGFTTCCAALIHSDGHMQIANAGNPSPYCDGEELTTLPGLPLGLTFDAIYEETLHVLATRRPLTFVSDGVIEATSPKTKELFGFDRTRAISQQSAEAIAAAAVSHSAGMAQGDDITVLTILRT